MGRIGLSKDEFVKKAKLVHGDRYNYDNVNYTNNKVKVCIVCPEHGEFRQTPSDHLKGRGCPICWRKKKTTETYIEQVKKIHGDKYIYDKIEYAGSHKKICVICPKHGEFFIRADAFLSGQGCPGCKSETVKEKQKKSTEQFIDDARKIHGDKYDYSKVEYVNARTKVCIICPEHGEFLQTPNLHLCGRGCSFCEESSLEREIRVLLEENNIGFIKEKEFDGLIGDKRNLKFDFYVPSRKTAIECQGEQHFKSVDFFGGDEAYEKRKMNDKRKKDYCKDNGITLLYYGKTGGDEVIRDKTEILTKMEDIPL